MQVGVRVRVRVEELRTGVPSIEGSRHAIGFDVSALDPCPGKHTYHTARPTRTRKHTYRTLHMDCTHGWMATPLIVQ